MHGRRFSAKHFLMHMGLRIFFSFVARGWFD